MVEQSALQASGPSTLLSVRESQVLTLTARGLTNREIASELHVTSHAIKFHLSSIYRKLGVANRTEAVVVYMTELMGTDAGARKSAPALDAGQAPDALGPSLSATG